ncbi:MAG TPA: sulfotransferase [Thermoanaerobaculia bacterium]
MSSANPIFVLSSARSGSTLTRFILDTHPEIYSPSELELGKVARGLCATIGLLEGATEQPLENPPALERTRAILADLLDSYTRARGKTIWCEKSPSNVYTWELLAAVFPGARFLCLHRHALDVTSSLIETFRFGFPPGLRDWARRFAGDNIQAGLRYWVDSTGHVVECEKRLPERSFRLRYEDIVAAPAEALAPAFRFLGLDWDPALLGSVFSSQHDRGGGDPYVFFSERIRQDSVGCGRSLPLEGLPGDLLRRLGELYAELGYPEKPARLEPAASAVAVAPAPAGPAADPQTRWVFETLLPERAATAGVLPPAPFACDVTVRGQGGGTWALEWDADGLRVAPERRGFPTTIELAGEDLLAVVQGRANPMKIAQEGRIRVEGLESDGALLGLLRMMWAGP